MSELRNLPASQSATLSPFAALRNQMDRIFEDFSLGLSAPMLTNGLEFLPNTEVVDGAKSITLSMELPGLDSEDVKITAEDRLITISGEKKQSSETDKDGILRSERSYGSFMRSFSTPFPIDADKIDARFEKGVLTISIEKPEGYSEGAKQIEIKH